MSSFDIFLKGINPARIEEADQIKQRASEYLKLDSAQLDKLLSSPGTSCFRRGAPEEEAKECQIALAKIGIVCVYKPGAAPSKLSLTAIESDEAGDVQTCPNCKHSEPIVENEPKPTNCKQCGINYEKFIETQKQKAEAEEIRNNILRAEKAKAAFENKQRQEEAEEKRKKELEGQILKEIKGKQSEKLQQVKMLASTVAALVVVGGLAYGVSSTFVGQAGAPPSTETQQSAVAGSADGVPSDAASAGGNVASTPEGVQASMQDAHDKANKVLNSFGMDADAMANNTSGGGSAPATPGSEQVGVDNASAMSGGATSPVASSDQVLTPVANNTQVGNTSANSGVSAQVTTSDGSAAGSAPLENAKPQDNSAASVPTAMLAKGENVPEWDLFLSKKISALIAKNKLQDAFGLASHIADTERYVDALGGVWLAAQQAKNSKLAGQLQAALEQKISALALDHQADYFAQAGRYQQRATGSSAMLERAEQLFAQLTDPERRLKASLMIAVSYFKVGNIESANRFFAQTNALLSKVPVARQINARVEIARAHQEAGDKNNALTWLASTQTPTSKLSNDSRLALVEGYARMAELNDVLRLVKQVAPGDSQNELLSKAIDTSLNANFAQNALTLGKEIQNPSYKALVYEQIASYISPETDVLAIAEQNLKEIASPSEQAIVASLLARHYARMANPQKVQALAKLASESMAKVPSTAKDEVMMVMAKNFARSLQTELARTQLAAIQSPLLQAEVQAEINKSNEVKLMLKVL